MVVRSPLQSTSSLTASWLHRLPAFLLVFFSLFHSGLRGHGGSLIDVST